MAEIALNTATPDAKQRPSVYGSVHIDNLGFVANASEAIQYISAPAAGKLKAVSVMADVTSDGTKTYTITMVNENNSDAAMLGTTVYDADPVLTAGTLASATLSATAANLVVDKGDIISVHMTGGTGSGNVGIVIEWDLS